MTSRLILQPVLYNAEIHLWLLAPSFPDPTPVRVERGRSYYTARRSSLRANLAPITRPSVAWWFVVRRDSFG